MSEAAVQVRATTEYVAGSHNPWQFRYHIEIENRGTLTLHLLRRRWLITDANGKSLEVEGAGVMGEQPFIAPGETYRYESGVPLNTPLGVMEGSYLMQDEAGSAFTVPIAPFTLAIPNIIN